MDNFKNIDITSMTITDLENIKTSLNIDFDDYWSYDVLLSELQSDNSKYFVAKNITDNTILGFIGIKQILDTADLMNIVVSKNFRNNGIARLLLNHILDYCKTSSISTLLLEVSKENEYAIKLYTSIGFKIISTRKGYYNGIDALIMRLNFN